MRWVKMAKIYELPCYSNNIKSVSLRTCPYDHWHTNKAHLSAITVTNIYKIFTYKMVAKSSGLDAEENYVNVTLCDTSKLVDNSLTYEN